MVTTWDKWKARTFAPGTFPARYGKDLPPRSFPFKLTLRR